MEFKEAETDKKRAKFSEEQIKKLQRVFEQFEFIDINQSRLLAEEFGVTTRQVRNWFQNKRAAIRRKKFKESGLKYPLTMKVSPNWSPFAANENALLQYPSSSRSPSPSTSREDNSRSPVPNVLDESASSSRGASPVSTRASTTSGGTSPSSSYISSAGNSPSRSPFTSGYGPSSTESSLDCSTNYGSYLTAPSNFSSRGFPRALFQTPRSSSPRAFQPGPSSSTWRLPLAELSLNYLSDSSATDATPEEEGHPPGPFQIYVTPPTDAAKTSLSTADLDPIDWTLENISPTIAALEQMAPADEDNRRDSSQPKTYMDLDALDLNTTLDDDSGITTYLSEIEADYERKQRSVENIINYLKD